MSKGAILNLLYVKKDYAQAEKLCKEQQGKEYDEYLAMCLYLQNKYVEAAELFRSLKKYGEEGYCCFYAGDKAAADKIWFTADEDISPLIKWAKSFSEFVERKNNRVPTFFQIRIFYENDLDMLLSNGFDDYAENLIESIQFFEDINPEIYKFTARVLYNHKYYNYADKFLSAAKKYGDEDCELYFLDAKNNIAQKRFYSAVKSLEKSLSVSKNYYPSKILFENLKRYC